MNEIYLIKLDIFEDGKFYESMIIDTVFKSEEGCESALLANGYTYVDEKLTLILEGTTSVAEIKEIKL